MVEKKEEEECGERRLDLKEQRGVAVHKAVGWMREVEPITRSRLKDQSRLAQHRPGGCPP